MSPFWFSFQRPHHNYTSPNIIVNLIILVVIIMNGGLLDYILLRCPFCKYVWSKREERMPISCPRCKKRFDYRGNHVEPEQRTLTAESYSDLRECLYDANRHSLQCASLEEVLDRMAQS